MDVKKININQSELTYNIASDIYDVTARNNGATFESLQTLLSAENLSTLIPTAVRCGGMTIRFIQSSDNKYVQYRLMSTSFSTDEANWQGTDEPTARNMILAWNTDIATTRKQVLSKYRKPGVQISYKDPNNGWINEQYIGTSVSNTDWSKDNNWKTIPNLMDINSISFAKRDFIATYISDTPKELSSDLNYTGYYSYSYSNSSIVLDSGIANFKIFKYTLSNDDNVLHIQVNNSYSINDKSLVPIFFKKGNVTYIITNDLINTNQIDLYIKVPFGSGEVFVGAHSTNTPIVEAFSAVEKENIVQLDFSDVYFSTAKDKVTEQFRKKGLQLSCKDGVFLLTSLDYDNGWLNISDVSNTLDELKTAVSEDIQEAVVSSFDESYSFFATGASWVQIPFEGILKSIKFTPCTTTPQAALFDINSDSIITNIIDIPLTVTAVRETITLEVDVPIKKNQIFLINSLAFKDQVSLPLADSYERGFCNNNSTDGFNYPVLGKKLTLGQKSVYMGSFELLIEKQSPIFNAINNNANEINKLKEGLSKIQSSKSIPPVNADVLHFIMYGQSLSRGHGTGTPIGKEIDTPNCIGWKYSGLFDKGVILGVTPEEYVQNMQEYDNQIFKTKQYKEQGSDSYPYDGSYSWADGQIQIWGESPSYGAFEALYKANGGIPFYYFVSNNGRGGNNIESLSKKTYSGTLDYKDYPYGNLIKEITKAKELFETKVVKYKVMGVYWVQGEGNGSTSDYKDKLIKLYNDLNTDIKSITNQEEDILLVTYQTALATKCLSGEAQLQAALENKNIILGATVYNLKHTDTLHLNNQGSRELGNGLGLRMYQALAGYDVSPLRPISVKVQGTDILLRMNRKVVLDRNNIKHSTTLGLVDKNSKGFYCMEDGTNIIQSIDVNGYDITLHCSKTPTGNLYYGTNSDDFGTIGGYIREDWDFKGVDDNVICCYMPVQKISMTNNLIDIVE